MRKERIARGYLLGLCIWLLISGFGLTVFSVNASASDAAAIDTNPDAAITNMPKPAVAGDTGAFKYTFSPIKGVEVTGTIEFRSDTPEILRVDAKGNWTALKAGKATISAVKKELSQESYDALKEKFPNAEFLPNTAGQIFYMDITAAGQDVQRLYNPNSGEHFFTTSTEERDQLKKQGWKTEDIGWKSAPGTEAPVYRLYNPNNGSHHYTMNANENKKLADLGWKEEGIAFYAFKSSKTPIYRLYNPHASSGFHHFTRSRQERNDLINQGWKSEGEAWFE